MSSFVSAVLMLLVTSSVLAQSQAGNQVSVVATSQVSYDSTTGLFTYSYIFASGGESLQEVETVRVALPFKTAMNVKAPAGWIGTVFKDGSYVSWCACAEEGIVPPPGWIDNGQILPSRHQIKPGQTQAGFSFQSPDPPGIGSFYATGFVQIPVEGVDFPSGQPPIVPTFPNDSFAGSLQVPLRVESAFSGGRRPAVDSFVVFLTLADNDSKSAPVLVDVVMGPNGEVVYPDTFRATLNGVDITAQFLPMANNRRRAYLELKAGSSLKTGSNVLSTSMDGQVPGAARTATDSDRIRFVVQ